LRNQNKRKRKYVQLKFSSETCSQTPLICVGAEVLTVVIMKSSIFWDRTPCSPLKVNRRFAGPCRFQIQGSRVSLARNKHGAGPYCLNSVISQKTELLTLKLQFSRHNIFKPMKFKITVFWYVTPRSVVKWAPPFRRIMVPSYSS
jgi:hypothetical protein